MPPPFSIAQLRQKLRCHAAGRLAESVELTHAAVALILREGAPQAGSRMESCAEGQAERRVEGRATPLGSPTGPELLVIRRAEHPMDPWSGDLGFPGGRLEPGDATPEAAARRETREELGLDLSASARLLGPLGERRARARTPQPLSIFPFVYELGPTQESSEGGRRGGDLRLNHPVGFQLNPAEVVAVHWVPLAFFANPQNRVSLQHPRRPEVTLRGYPVGEKVLWGLSLEMLEELLF